MAPSARRTLARTASINLVRSLISNSAIFLAMGLKLGVCVAQKSSKSANRIVTLIELVTTPSNPARSNNVFSAVRPVFSAPGVGATEAPSWRSPRRSGQVGESSAAKSQT